MPGGFPNINQNSYSRHKINNTTNHAPINRTSLTTIPTLGKEEPNLWLVLRPVTITN